MQTLWTSTTLMFKDRKRRWRTGRRGKGDGDWDGGGERERRKERRKTIEAGRSTYGGRKKRALLFLEYLLCATDHGPGSFLATLPLVALSLHSPNGGDYISVCNP